MRTLFATAALATATVIGGAGAATADPFPSAHAVGATQYSPGLVSGNVVQVPVHLPVNACGNTVSVIGALNPAFGNACFNR
ncbi:chaplin [Streptomyces sp. NBC_01381]|uniref:chaplin n=1 Tax=Streptomyces sp. NBC_01381 TaxID=2903845 RepID=UPI0022569EC9|nr:chaplin [Streptomyces sp. NBC_01381]MCX4667423.1 chaplin [Streptomyces sp. NBC_01381]